MVCLGPSLLSALLTLLNKPSYFSKRSIWHCAIYIRSGISFFYWSNSFNNSWAESTDTVLHYKKIDEGLYLQDDCFLPIFMTYKKREYQRGVQDGHGGVQLR